MQLTSQKSVEGSYLTVSNKSLTLQNTFLKEPQCCNIIIPTLSLQVGKRKHQLSNLPVAQSKSGEENVENEWEMYGNPVHSGQICREPKTALKHKVYLFIYLFKGRT